MVGDTLEMLSFYSENVNAALYEKLLGKQVSDTFDDARMMKIVWDGLGTDFGQTYYWAFLKTDIWRLMVLLTPEDATQSVASFVDAREDKVDKILKKFLTDTKNRQ
jgi:hypothetical protein